MGGRGKDTIKSFPYSSEAREKTRAQKITEARRVGAPRNIASRAERGELTRFFEMRSNFFKNVHQKGNRVGSGGSAGCAQPPCFRKSRLEHSAVGETKKNAKILPIRLWRKELK
jgi:hypothetical protein